MMDAEARWRRMYQEWCKVQDDLGDRIFDLEHFIEEKGLMDEFKHWAGELNTRSWQKGQDT